MHTASLACLARWLPPWCRLWCALLTNLIAGLVCVLLCAAAWHFIQDERAAGTRLTFGVDAWVVQYIFPLGFLTMALRFALHTLAILLPRVQRPPQP